MAQLLCTTYPEIMREIVNLDTYDFDLQTVTIRSAKKLTFQCSQGHQWTTHVYSRTRGRGCPTCAKNAASAQGDKQAQTLKHTHPELLSFIKEDEQQEASTCYATQNKYFTFVHPLDSQLTVRWKLKDAVSKYEAHWFENLPDNWVLLPSDAPIYDPSIYYPSASWRFDTTIFSWKCELGHQWEAPLRDIHMQRYCPYCQGRKLLTGFNDFATQYPLLLDWLNQELPLHVPKPNTKYEWQCPECSYEFTKRLASMTTPSCPRCGSRHGTVAPGINDLVTAFPYAAKCYDTKLNTVPLANVNPYAREKAFFECPSGHSFSARLDMVTKRQSLSCPRCSSSGGEQALLDFIESIEDSEIMLHDRTVLQGKELDVYIPSKGIAIEYNGLYWHSDLHHSDTNYHYNKWKMCKEQGIHLITVWEDDWMNRTSTVKEMLTHKLGLSKQRHLGARQTHVEVIDYQLAQPFLEAHHIQGAVTGSYYLGLYDPHHELIAVTVWRKTQNMLYLQRYCSSCVVAGGLGKMLAQARAWGIAQHCTEIVTFSDHEISDGDLYRRLGFEFDRELYPDYRYVYQERRHHKFGFRKVRFRNDNMLLFDDTLSESELAQLNGLYRVWDAGKDRWKMTL